MKKILAVSGGVDSMVMLAMILEKCPASEVVVATFNHGTRETSAEDAHFVERICQERGVNCVMGQANLGPSASEETARKARYNFLRQVAFEESGEIYTAHHLDDLAESITINFVRGTGFRGLAPMSSVGIRRPFLDGFFSPNEFGFPAFDRRAILRYAAEHDISFRQDPTNVSPKFLRNRVRDITFNLPLKTKLEIFQLWQKQRHIVKEIDDIIESILPEDLRFFRATFQETEREVGLELLRGGLLRAGISATGQKTNEFYDAILCYAPGKSFNLPNTRLIKLNKKDFML